MFLLVAPWRRWKGQARDIANYPFSRQLPPAPSQEIDVTPDRNLREPGYEPGPRGIVFRGISQVDQKRIVADGIDRVRFRGEHGQPDGPTERRKDAPGDGISSHGITGKDPAMKRVETSPLTPRSTSGHEHPAARP
jgi:hypothetical protein